MECSDKHYINLKKSLHPQPTPYLQASIAQSAERLAVNQKVIGSSPIGSVSHLFPFLSFPFLYSPF